MSMKTEIEPNEELYGVMRGYAEYHQYSDAIDWLGVSVILGDENVIFTKAGDPRATRAPETHYRVQIDRDADDTAELARQATEIVYLLTIGQDANIRDFGLKEY